MRSLWAKTIRSLIVAKVRSLDIRQGCLIVGEGAWLTRRLGGRGSWIFEHSPGRRESRSFGEAGKEPEVCLVGFGIYTPFLENITMQTIKCSLLLNCIDLNKRNELFGDIVYLNYVCQSLGGGFALLSKQPRPSGRSR